MKKSIFLFLLLATSFSLSAQLRLEVEGKVEITQLDENNTADSVVVWLPDNTLGRRSANTLGGSGSADTWLISGNDMTAIPIGNVGIGTTSPDAKLDVEGDVKILGKMNIDFGMSNTIIGKNAGTNNTGSFNTYVGNAAGQNNISGSNNTFLGKEAGVHNKGNNNTFLGTNTGSKELNNIGNDNTFIGRRAGAENTIGNENTFVGREAGITNSSGSFNTFIGKDAGASSANHAQSKSIAIGYNAEVNCANCAVIGGTGADAVKVGISTTTPLAKLHIVGGGDAELDKHGFIVNGSITGQNLVIDNNEIISRDNETASELYLNAGSGNVAVGLTTIPSCKLDVGGDICSNGSMISSDSRYKKNIKKIENPLVQILQLEGYSYQMRKKDFNARNFSEGKKIGLIAQNVEKVFPELVKTFDNGYKAVNYDGLIPVLVEGIKAQQATIATQEKEMTFLKEKIEQERQQRLKLENKVAELTTLVEKLLNVSSETPKKHQFNQ